MAEEQAKNKRFVLTDESLNSSGFWLLTSGGDLSQFKKNPIMLWSHSRVWKGTEDEVLPMGYWKDIEKTADGKLIAEPFFDADDPFALKIKNKVDKGIIRMASVGIRVIETSADKKYMKPGQTRETITKWQLIEASICDIGRNDNALAFYDTEDNLITFSEEGADCPVKLLETNLIIKNSMQSVTNLLNLSESASEQDVFSSVKGIMDESEQLKAEKMTREQHLRAKQQSEAKSLLDEAFKDGRLNDDEQHALRKAWELLFENNHEGSKQALQAVFKPQSVKEQFAGKTEAFRTGDIWNKRQEEIKQNLKK